MYFRHICVGPRLSSLLVDLSEEEDEGEVSLDDVTRLLPPTSTLVLCAYVFQDLAQSVLTKLPGHVALAQYGFLVSTILETMSHHFSEYVHHVILTPKMLVMTIDALGHL